MDFDRKKHLTARISGLIAITVGVILLLLTVANLISVLGIKQPNKSDEVILSHILWSIAHLALIGFGVSAIAKPVLKIKRTLMGETKKYCWNYAKPLHSIGLIIVSTILFAFSYLVAKTYTYNKTSMEVVLFYIQLLICPCYVATIILQILSLSIKDNRVYNQNYKLITKETSPTDFYNSEIAREKSFNNAKYLSGKLAGGFAVASALIFLVESIYVFFNTLLNGFDVSVEGRAVFLFTLAITVAKIAVSAIYINFGLKMMERPVQKIIPSALYSQRKEGRFRWLYAKNGYFITFIVLSSIFALFGSFGDFSVKTYLHPVIMLVYTITPVAIIPFYLCVVCYVATVVLSIIFLSIRDRNVYELELNVYASLYRKTLI